MLWEIPGTPLDFLGLFSERKPGRPEGQGWGLPRCSPLAWSGTRPFGLGHFGAGLFPSPAARPPQGQGGMLRPAKGRALLQGTGLALPWGPWRLSPHHGQGDGVCKARGLGGRGGGRDSPPQGESPALHGGAMGTPWGPCRLGRHLVGPRAVLGAPCSASVPASPVSAVPQSGCGGARAACP